MKVLFLNNKDSFVWNLVDYVSVFEPDTVVVPNTISLTKVKKIDPDAIVVSPGPGNPHNPDDIGTCIDIISGLMVQGAEGIVLGCTELPLLIRPGDINVPIFDTTRLHAEAAVKMALAEG